jgi:hypothetical protein
LPEPGGRKNNQRDNSAGKIKGEKIKARAGILFAMTQRLNYSSRRSYCKKAAGPLSPHFSFEKYSH